MRPMMRLPDIDKKLKQALLLARVWFWAAMHSPNFQGCQLYLSRPPIRMSVYWVGSSYGYLLIQISLHCLKLSLDIPWHVYSAFVKARKEQGEIIPDPNDDIPF
jgi:hypothetical protein